MKKTRECEGRREGKEGVGWGGERGRGGYAEREEGVGGGGSGIFKETLHQKSLCE